MGSWGWKGLSSFYFFPEFQISFFFLCVSPDILAICFDVVFSFLVLSIFWGLRGSYFFGFALFFVALIEIRRTPFDLVEGESELVSRYNIEYGRLRFTFLFLREYLRLVFFGCFLLSYFTFFGLPRKDMFS